MNSVQFSGIRYLHGNKDAVESRLEQLYERAQRDKMALKAIRYENNQGEGVLLDGDDAVRFLSQSHDMEVPPEVLSLKSQAQADALMADPTTKAKVDAFVEKLMGLFSAPNLEYTSSSMFDYLKASKGKDANGKKVRETNVDASFFTGLFQRGR